MEAITLELPYPPSINNYWLAAGGGQRRLSDKGREFRDRVAVECRLADARKFAGDVSVCIRLYAPDRRRRDIDNGLKCLIDALQHACVFADDEQVVSLTVTKTRFPNDAPGKCIVTVADSVPPLVSAGSRRRNL